MSLRNEVLVVIGVVVIGVAAWIQYVNDYNLNIIVAGVFILFAMALGYWIRG